MLTSVPVGEVSGGGNVLGKKSGPWGGEWGRVVVLGEGVLVLALVHISHWLRSRWDNFMVVAVCGAIDIRPVSPVCKDAAALVADGPPCDGADVNDVIEGLLGQDSPELDVDVWPIQSLGETLLLTAIEKTAMAMPLGTGGRAALKPHVVDALPFDERKTQASSFQSRCQHVLIICELVLESLPRGGPLRAELGETFQRIPPHC